ncbi:MAG: c-type cytochrome [Pseudomonadales bacterium]
MLALSVWMSGLLLAAVAAAVEPVPSPIPTLTDADIESGQALFRVHCARCHGMLGDGGEGPSLRRPTLRYARDDHALFEVILEGIPGTGMPRTWAPNDGELWQIAGYVKSLGRLPAEPMPGDPAGGRVLYETQNCAACHISRGEGRGVGPELSDVGLRRNAEYLRRALTNPDADSPILTSQLTGNINAFLTLRLTAPDGEYEGLRVSEDEFSVQLRDLSGRLHSFDKRGLLSYERAFGHSLMPGYATRLTETQTDDLVSYLMSLKGGL